MTIEGMGERAGYDSSSTSGAGGKNFGFKNKLAQKVKDADYVIQKERNLELDYDK